MTNQSLLEVYDARPNFWDMVAKKSLTWYSKFAKMLHPQTIGGMYAFIYDISPIDADNFMEQLCTGQNVTNSTIFLLRTKIMEDRVSLRKLPKNVIIALIIKTWNCFRENKELKMLKFTQESDNFPIAI